MISLTFVYPHDMMFQAVKEESSQLAIRRSDKDDNSMFEQLVFDEAYLSKFRQLFFNAQGQIVPTLAAYMVDVPVEPAYFERQDFSKNRDYTFHLIMPGDFNKHMARPIEDYIFSFMKDWIMYQWLETKSPEDAAYYLAKTEKYKTDVNAGLSKKIAPVRRRGYYF